MNGMKMVGTRTKKYVFTTYNIEKSEDNWLDDLQEPQNFQEIIIKKKKNGEKVSKKEYSITTKRPQIGQKVGGWVGRYKAG